MRRSMGQHMKTEVTGLSTDNTFATGDLLFGNFTVHGIRDKWVNNWVQTQGDCPNCVFADLIRDTQYLGQYPNPFYQAEAIYFDHGWEFMGHEGDKGGFLVLVGEDKGNFYSFKEGTRGGISTSAGYAGEIGRVDVTGNPNLFTSDFFYGFREKWYASYGGFISGGIGYSTSMSGGQPVTAISVQIGFGLNLWPLSGGYNQGVIEKR